MIFIVICIQNAANSLPLRHNFFSQLWFNFWVDNMGWYISFHRRTGTNQVLITMSIIYSTNAWPQFGVSLNKGLKKKMWFIHYCNTGWGVFNRGTKLERFSPKNQHSQRKLLNLENWFNGEASKSVHIWISKSIFYVKNQLTF